MSVGRVEVKWLNRLVLEDIYLEDKNGDMMIEAAHISAGFELLPLLKQKFIFTTVRAFGLSANLNRATPEDELNLQFVIDAFASNDTTKKSTNIDLRFNSVIIRRGNLKYNVISEQHTPDKFNPKHIDVSNISADIAIRAFNKDSLNAHIRKLSLKESSGVSLDRLALNLVGNRDSVSVKDFQLRLPNTDFRIEEAYIGLSEINSFTELVDNAPVKLKITQSEICLSDLRAFVPAFSNFNEPIDLFADADGYINNINLKQLTLDYSDKMQFVGRMELKGISTPEDTYLYGQVSRMQITTDGIKGIANNFSENQIIDFPDWVEQLGTARFTGQISGFLDNLVAYGRFSSEVGSVEADINFGSDKEKNIGTFLKGHIASSELNIDKLFLADNPYGSAQFSVSLDAVRPMNGKFAGKIDADIMAFDYKDYNYQNLLFSGNFNANGFDGTIDLDDENVQLTAQGTFQNMGANSVFNFTADVKDFRPDKLNLTDQYDEPEVSFSINADFTGDNIDNLNGNISLDSLSFITQSDNFMLDELRITASGKSSNRRLSITSDILNGEVEGAYSFTTFVPDFINTVKEYFPVLDDGKRSNRRVNENNFSFLLTVENTEEMSKLFKLPVTIIDQSHVIGHYNNQYNKFRLEAYLPKFNAGASMFESGYLVCDNQHDEMTLGLKVVHYNAKGVRNYLEVNSDAKDNNINTFLTWKNNKENAYKAGIHTSTLFSKEETERGVQTILTEVSLTPDYFVINDSVWNIEPSLITIKDGSISVDKFFASQGDDYLLLDGTISKDPLDVMLLELKEVELSYIFNTVNIPVLQFGGRATGTINMNDLYSSRMLNADLEIQDFSFNQVTLGQLNLFSEWDDVQQGILMLGSIYKNDSTWTDINGYIYPVGAKSGLSLYFDANDLDLSFLGPFLDNITSSIKGRGFGTAHLHGSFIDVTVEGEAFVQNAEVGIDFLNTTYYFSDSVYLTDSSIKANNLTLYDKFGNKGSANIDVEHSYFRDFKFDINVQADNLLVYDKAEYEEPMIFGTVFGRGSASILGNEQVIDFDINMRSAPNSTVTFNFMTSSTASDYDFISFVNKNGQETISADSVRKDIITIPTNTGAEIRMNLLVDITPDASITLVMDPTAGDKIKGHGTGSLQVQYGTNTDLKMYGIVDIIDGSYNFSLQQLIHKDFKIREGSTVEFRGDPLEAILDINTTYSLTANIGDLNQSFIMESPRMNVPVNCVLMLNGLMRSPNVTFDLELPGSNAELERQVRSLIETEDLMTTQIVYLLVLNKFYTSDSYIGYSRNEFGAVASSALSAQLSSILSSFTDKVQLGTNIRSNSQDGISDTEVEMLMSSQLLDNRLIFNGNFGVRRNAFLGQESTFVGEFDLEYKLTRSGEIRLKAYSHANDMYRYLKSLTTQGIGVMYRKDFTNFSDIFRRRRRPVIVLTPELDNSTTPSEVIVE